MSVVTPLMVEVLNKLEAVQFQGELFEFDQIKTWIE